MAEICPKCGALNGPGGICYCHRVIPIVPTITTLEVESLRAELFEARRQLGELEKLLAERTRSNKERVNSLLFKLAQAEQICLDMANDNFSIPDAHGGKFAKLYARNSLLAAAGEIRKLLDAERESPRV